MNNYFPDGTLINDWFLVNNKTNIDNLGKKYYLKDYIKPDNNVNTKQIQELIDKIHNENGGVLIVSDGVYKTGALFLKQGVNLFIDKDAEILGSDDISDYPVMETRIEGETCMYYPALINADSVDGIYIGGAGKINGNGFKSWKAFWKRREWNPNCTNKDEQRPRLLYISNKVGSETLGIFNIIMSIYLFFITLATSGIKIATTRFVVR